MMLKSNYFNTNGAESFDANSFVCIVFVGTHDERHQTRMRQPPQALSTREKFRFFISRVRAPKLENLVKNLQRCCRSRSCTVIPRKHNRDSLIFYVGLTYQIVLFHMHIMQRFSANSRTKTSCFIRTLCMTLCRTRMQLHRKKKMSARWPNPSETFDNATYNDSNYYILYIFLVSV